MNQNDLVGRKHEFEDGDSITVIQIKRRDDGEYVTYHVQKGPGIPQKLVLPMIEFMDYYGHLFGIKTDDILPNQE
jgi:hypothetical protein